MVDLAPTSAACSVSRKLEPSASAMGQESARVYSSLFSLFDFIPLPVHAALLVGGYHTLERLSRNDLWEIKENTLSQPKVIAIALTD